MMSTQQLDHPTDRRRAAAAERFPSRIPPLRAAMRRRFRGLLLQLFGPTQLARQTQLAILPVPPKHILFLGDSITDFGMWHEWFSGLPTVNRGIGGETTEQVLARVDIVVNAPLAVFLLIGTNDISGAIQTSNIVGNLRAIVTAIQGRAPGSPIFVQSIMPRTLKYREEITHLNRLYREVVAASGANVTYVDLWPALATPAGAMHPDLTEDNVHLNGEGYRVWVDQLRPIISNLAKPTPSIGQS
jgi:lysophospholipase L1-like esterase